MMRDVSYWKAFSPVIAIVQTYRGGGRRKNVINRIWDCFDLVHLYWEQSLKASSKGKYLRTPIKCLSRFFLNQKLKNGRWSHSRLFCLFHGRSYKIVTFCVYLESLYHDCTTSWHNGWKGNRELNFLLSCLLHIWLCRSLSCLEWGKRCSLFLV